ncbi:hypothetical protein [Ammoniphilus sp. CFH 90114]|uniref:hypothetical protein n=1 Tax=Ammoniphilus sp. CFH 90114 TaxID=2493665 RepID=UPI00100E1055|nr:hypothetical protein [Ammoniphilus sp. CFH 90114]RXT15387.1 hypothetical protein EIZ39_04080 [Ammoniphilus sp. CFH 90114]
MELGDLSITKGVTKTVPLSEIMGFIQRFADGDYGEFNVLNQKDNPVDGYTGRYAWKDGIKVLVDHDIQENMTIVSLPNELD